MSASDNADLTRRQREALEAVARHDGYQEEAARDLGIARGTLVNHVQHAYRKLGVTSAPEAWRVLGWLRPPER